MHTLHVCLEEHAVPHTYGSAVSLPLFGMARLPVPTSPRWLPRLYHPWLQRLCCGVRSWLLQLAHTLHNQQLASELVLFFRTGLLCSWHT